MEIETGNCRGIYLLSVVSGHPKHRWNGSLPRVPAAGKGCQNIISGQYLSLTFSLMFFIFPHHLYQHIILYRYVGMAVNTVFG